MLSIIEIQKLEPFYIKNPKSLSVSIRQSFIYAKAFYDRFFFVEYFLQPFTYIIEEARLECPPYFAELRDALDNWWDIDLIVPRWHAKTTGILIRILHSICYGTTKWILYIAKEKLWEKWMWRIRGEMETNQRILAFYWNLVPQNSDDLKDHHLKKRRNTFLEFTNGCRMQTLTMWQSPRGQRTNKVIIDDPQDNGDVVSKDRIEAFNTWVFTSLYNTLLPWWSMAVIWTIVWEMCLVKHLRDDKMRPTIEYQACDEEFNNILRPQMWTKEALEDRWKKLGSALFNQEYRNVPLARGNTLIRQEWIKVIKKEDLPKAWDKVLMWIDPAITEKESSDYTWWCVVWISWENKYVLASFQVRLTPVKNEEFILSKYNQYNPDYVVKEDNIERWITEHLKLKWVRIKWVIAHKDKYARLLEVAPQIEMWKVFFCEWNDELIYQLTSFPDTAHDDIMDSFVYALLEKRTRSVWIKTF